MNNEERNGLIKQRRLLREKCEKKDKEIERLNNIINELEKILIIEISEAGFHYEKIKEDTLQWIFNELQILKGSNENG